MLSSKTPLSPTLLPSSRSFVVRRLSLRHILVTLCLLVSILLLVALQAAHSGRFPSIAGSWAGPPPAGVTQLRNPWSSLPGSGSASAQLTLSSIPDAVKIGEQKGINSDDNNYKSVVCLPPHLPSSRLPLLPHRPSFMATHHTPPTHTTGTTPRQSSAS